MISCTKIKFYLDFKLSNFMLIDLLCQLTWSLTIVIEIRNIKCVISCCVHHTRDIMSISFEFCYGFSIILRMVFKLRIFWKIGLSTLDFRTWKIVTRMRNIFFKSKKKSGFIEKFEQYRWIDVEKVVKSIFPLLRPSFSLSLFFS